MAKTPNKRQRPRWWQIAILLPLLPPIVVIAILALVINAVVGIILRISIWSSWCLRGQDVLFVYSDSPHWHDYVEQNILSQLGDRAIVLNWSKRKRWQLSLAKIAFYHFGTYRQFNPLGVVFRPLGRTHIFRFWKPFRDLKHGHPEALRKMENDFFGVIGFQRRTS